MDKIFYLNSFFHLSPQMNLIMNRLLPVGGKLDYSSTVKLNPRASIPSSSLHDNTIHFEELSSETLLASDPNTVWVNCKERISSMMDQSKS